MKRRGQAAGLKRRRNPLSYLGWLGLAGVFGLWCGAPSLWVFLLCFFFFSYGNMPADELFWQNVRRAGLRAFAVQAGLFTALALYSIGDTVLAFYTTGIPTPDLFSTEELMQGYRVMLGLLILIFMVSIAVFLVSLMIFSHREKQYTEEEEPSC